MTKTELSQLLNDVMGADPVTEEIAAGTNFDAGLPRLSYHEYVWTPMNASGQEQGTIVTYQVDFYSCYPRHEKLLALKQAFKEKGISLQIFHEGLALDQGSPVIHSYFSVDVVEDV